MVGNKKDVQAHDNKTIAQVKKVTQDNYGWLWIRTIDGQVLEFQEAKLEQIKEDAKEELMFLEKLRKILNEYHSQIPMVEIGRENVLNDIDNELNLDKRIEQLKEVLK